MNVLQLWSQLLSDNPFPLKVPPSPQFQYWIEMFLSRSLHINIEIGEGGWGG